MPPSQRSHDTNKSDRSASRGGPPGLRGFDVRLAVATEWKVGVGTVQVGPVYRRYLKLEERGV
jgi:hypothetical protein